MATIGLCVGCGYVRWGLRRVRISPTTTVMMCLRCRNAHEAGYRRADEWIAETNRRTEERRS